MQGIERKIPMLKKILLPVLAVAALGGAAHADDARRELQYSLFTFSSEAKQLSWSHGTESHQDPQKCRDRVASAKAAGVSDAETLAGTTCDDYAVMYAHQKLIADVQGGYDTAEWMRAVTVEEAGVQEGMADRPNACLAALDAMGKAGGDVIYLRDDAPVTVDAARAVCTQAVTDAKKFQGAVTDRLTAEHDKIEAVYKAVGIKGQRLELFTYYGMPETGSFRAAGCDRYVDTAKALKKAKKLFIWLEVDDGTIIVRKYTFKGDKYSTSERTFARPDRAHAWCK
jgi:hypothetical protein